MTKHERIKELRLALGLNQKELAERIGHSQSSITMIESGRRSVNERFVKSLVATFGCSEEWLQNGEGDMFPISDSVVTPDDQTLMKYMEPEVDPVRKKLFAAIGRTIDRMSDEDLAALLDDLKSIIGE